MYDVARPVAHTESEHITCIYYSAVFEFRFDVIIIKEQEW